MWICPVCHTHSSSRICGTCGLLLSENYTAARTLCPVPDSDLRATFERRKAHQSRQQSAEVEKALEARLARLESQMSQLLSDMKALQEQLAKAPPVYVSASSAPATAPKDGPQLPTQNVPAASAAPAMTDSENQLQAAVLYHNGQTFASKKQHTSAVTCYLKAAQMGHLEAQYQLGWCYHHGQGVKKDVLAAAMWLKSASEKGHVYAKLQYNALFTMDNTKILNENGYFKDKRPINY